MFQFPRLPLAPYGFRRKFPPFEAGRLSDSGIPGSEPVCGYPELIAAYHALHRLSAPRHPPCALSSLTTRNRFARTPRSTRRTVAEIRYAIVKEHSNKCSKERTKKARNARAADSFVPTATPLTSMDPFLQTNLAESLLKPPPTEIVHPAPFFVNP